MPPLSLLHQQGIGPLRTGSEFLVHFGAELIFTAIVMVLCAVIYFKTKELYALSNHKGIKYFRTGFLFFGLAYLARFVMILFQISAWHLDVFFPRIILLLLFLVPVGYVSTMAFFYLAYSLVWKKIPYKLFVIGSNVIALGVSILALLLISPIIIALAQIPLLIIILLYVASKHKHKKNQAIITYLFIGLLWLLNIFFLGPRNVLPLEVNLFLLAASAGLFIYLLVKVLKWTK
ncbi:MAG: hypothetical protein H6502_02560 [Candidatus Woesearchaeota archaeon]|nr:MAG: hypothetical protein H6502_02560 [Candidatus Woesearchaeota archaeon]